MKILSIKYSVLIISTLFACIASAKDVLMAFSQEIPPNIFQKHNKGIEIDIISAPLAYKGHTLKQLYFPLGRILIAHSNNLVDAAMGGYGSRFTATGAFYADPGVIYDNIFITRFRFA